MLYFAGLYLMATLVLGQDLEANSPAYSHLKSLECFVGEWHATATIPDGSSTSEKLGEIAGNKVVVVMVVRWAPGKCAQIVDTSWDMKGVMKIEATSIRAWDQAAKQICDHTFTTQKGTWAGKWRQDGDIWVHEYKGMNLDGDKVIGRRVITFTDDGHFTLKESNTQNGETQPDIAWHFARQ